MPKKKSKPNNPPLGKANKKYASKVKKPKRKNPFDKWAKRLQVNKPPQ